MTQVLKKVFYYIMLALSFCSCALRNRSLTMRLAMVAYLSQGVGFCGIPRIPIRMPIWMVAGAYI